MAKAVSHIISGKSISDEMLIRFFKGELKGADHSQLDALLRSDELYKEVYADLSPEEFLTCLSINKSVNQRISKYPSSGGMKYYHYLGIAAVVALLFGWWMISNTSGDSPESKNNATIISQNSGKSETNENNVSEWTPYSDTWFESEKRTVNDNNGNEKSAIENVVPGNIDEIYKSHTGIIETDAEKKTDVNTDKKNDPVVSGDDTRKFDENAMIELEVSFAQVMVKNNLAEYDKTQSDPKRNVNDPNIGNAVVTKSNKSDYDIADMPYYEGGDRVLGVYIQSHLANKITIRRKQKIDNVMVSFELTAKGKVENVEVLGKNIPENVKKEIETVIKDAPGWKAGKKSGRKGAMQYMLSIGFY